MAIVGSAVLAALLISVTSGCAAEAGAPEHSTGSSASVARISMDAPARSAAAAVAVVPVALPGPGTSIILSEKVSKAIVAALKTGGSGAAVALCAVLVPAEFKDQCGVLVATLVAGLAATRELPAGQCLKISVKLGFPPVRVSIVPCPPGRPPGETATYVRDYPMPDLFPPAGVVELPPPDGARLIPGLGGLGVLIP